MTSNDLTRVPEQTTAFPIGRVSDELQSFLFYRAAKMPAAELAALLREFHAQSGCGGDADAFVGAVLAHNAGWRLAVERTRREQAAAEAGARRLAASVQ
ncbi:MAG TPA: hypothetical protein VH253_10890 [Phycisphaerae bacterium]|nr:hypothetical protein [Phycisphaerae bacterium]